MLMLEEQRISQICIIYEQRGAGTGGRDGCCVDDACIRKWNSVEFSRIECNLMLGGHTEIKIRTNSTVF